MCIKYVISFFFTFHFYIIKDGSIFDSVKLKEKYSHFSHKLIYGLGVDIWHTFPFFGKGHEFKSDLRGGGP